MAEGGLPSFYGIVDPLDTGRSPEELAGALLAGGAALLQLRLKDRPTAGLVEVGRRVRLLAAGAGARLVVNDRLDVALAVGADGVHLGQRDLPATVARRLLGPRRILGISTSSVDEARAAVAAGADYIGFGPIFPTTTKARALSPRGLESLRAVRAAVGIPIVAIGGITEARLPEVLAAGADAVAIVADVVRAPDMVAKVRRLVGLGARRRTPGGEA